ncbi:MAG: GAF domain-containing protein [Chloroflexota bacterium]
MPSPSRPLSHRPLDATLTVTKAARLIGVHANTIRAWSDQGRLRYYRINPRGDRRYRLSDVQRFLSVAEGLTHDPEQPVQRSRRRDEQARLGLRAINGAPITDAARPDSVGQYADLLANLAVVAARPDDADPATAAVRLIRDATGARLVAVLEAADGVLVPRAVAGADPARVPELPLSHPAIAAALRVAPHPEPDRDVTSATAALARPGDHEHLVALDTSTPTPAVLVIVPSGDTELEPSLLTQLGKAVGAVLVGSARAREIGRRLHRAEALRRVAHDIAGRLDLDDALGDLVDHALVLFSADRAAVFLRGPDGSAVASVARGLSATFLEAVRDFPARSLPSAAVAAKRPLFATGYARDARAADVRAAVVQEGFDTLCTAPLFDGSELLGLLNVYHDRPHDWSEAELDTLAALASHAAVAIRTARNYGRMATWTAQLQSIQKLGHRLSRLSDVASIGRAIATELRELIDYHNVRVYRVEGDEIVPVAMLGQVGGYVDETPDQLRVRVGEGITGWVVANRVAQNLPDAAKDPRAMTIPGTEDDLDESMLVAPIVHEDECLGAVVLAKLGLHQFSDDDLRLLEIYAAFAAQAMANADATARLREQSATLARQVQAQRELLRITESILTTLDAGEVLERITDRLGALVPCDNIAIEVDDASGVLVPVTARGLHSAQYLEPWKPGEMGVATWVVEHNEPVLIQDERADERVNHFRSVGPLDGSLIVVPLRGPAGAAGVLTLERLGLEQRLTTEEFELVQLFAAQVSIALRNADAHHAVELRARTDDLTGLQNHGTFEEWLRRAVAAGEGFSLVMIDLDRFKTVNDTLGHQAGDRLLREIGRAIVAAARDTDHVFRYGGDEFAVLLPRTEGGPAMAVADRIRAAIHGVGGLGSRWHDGGVHVSASIGVATWPADGGDADEVLLAADRACFVAKRTGRGLVATADEGLALAAEFTLSEPTPVDPPSPANAAPAPSIERRGPLEHESATGGRPR